MAIESVSSASSGAVASRKPEQVEKRPEPKKEEEPENRVASANDSSDKAAAEGKGNSLSVVA